METNKNESYGMMGDSKAHEGMHGDEWCVPLAALGMPGEDDQMVTPGVGDKVQFQAEGTLTRVEGDNAYVKPEAANGKPLTHESAATKDNPEPDEQEYATLKGQAQQQGMM